MIKKIFIFSALLLCFSCGKTPSMPEGERKPLVLVSIAPYQYLVDRIAGGAVDVHAVVPLGANPHAFEPTSLQVADISRGQMWFLIGEPFEEKILPIIKGRNPNFIVQDLRDGISLIEEGNSLACSHCSMDHFDRHIWLSPKLASKQAEGIARTLGEKFPDQKNHFAENLVVLQAELSELDLEIHTLLESVKERVILVSHPAFGYFCRDYDFEQLSVEYEGKDPRPKHLEQVLQRAISHGAELALALPQYNNKGAQLIAEKLHVPVHLIDPYSSDYFETMRKLANLIADPYEGAAK